ncbi:uncharacterized protein LOC8055924 isoform X2 [Sorghum bicolor]|uniref:uncharacterized protein LOC8055924 isoform X2 n=1 Tax=Sorghum bicolor TaxID=4558 RepID=UPI000B426B48|nr:uncharacterized protein LOC8055924 isoform X2 [Sorghum bicolor]|eukprot:XP_002448248.2 uncharacterized protein LOC8055924 isoform X2 [Sorghum bicolor]
MKDMQNNEGRTPFEDLTNTINCGGQSTSNSREQIDERVQRKREREKARSASMTQEQRDDKNKKLRKKYHQEKSEKNAIRRERYHQKKTFGVESTMKNYDGDEDSDWLHRDTSPCILIKITHVSIWAFFLVLILFSYACMMSRTRLIQFYYIYVDDYSNICIDQSGMIDITDASPDLNPGPINASTSINNVVTCPKERKREVERARRAAMSPEQKALLNKRRRDLYAQKNAARKLQMTPQENKVKRKESKKKYNTMVRENRANNLHPDSIAMESPHFNPQIIFPASPQSSEAPLDDMEIPEFGGTPVHIAPTVVQNLEVQTPELVAAQTIHIHRVTNGERNALLSHRNRVFEANIGGRARGCADGKCNDSNGLTQPSVVCNDGVTQQTPIQAPNNCNGTQTQPSVADGTSSMPPYSAQDHTSDSMVEDDYDEDVIFEEDEEEDEAYFFAGQDEDEGTDVDTYEQENHEPDVPDPYDRVYANVPSESHMLPSVPNCKHCNAKKFDGEPPGFCCRGGKIHLSSPETPPELMRLW